MFSLSAIYVLLDAQFIAAMQVLVYAGAIMVLFLFVIMLLNLGAHSTTDMKGIAGKIVSLVFGGLLVFELLILSNVTPAAQFRLPEGTLEQMAQEQGVVGLIAEPLFRGYLVPFEITSLLLLAAVVGAVVLAKRRI
jgi:NADH-quinone oxidoreductase subunit J